MYFVFIIKTRHKTASHDNGKITQKKISELFSCDYLTNRRNVEKGLITDTEASIQLRETDGFWLRRGILNEYMK